MNTLKKWWDKLTGKTKRNQLNRQMSLVDGQHRLVAAREAKEYEQRLRGL